MDRRADSTWDYSLSTCLGAHGGGEDLTKPFFPWVWKERRGESGETAKKKEKKKEAGRERGWRVRKGRCERIVCRKQ